MIKRGLALILASIFVLCACTEQGTPTRIHEADQRRTSHPNVTTASEEAGPSDRTDELNERFRSARDPLKEVILPLAQTVLAPSRIQDPASRASRTVQDELIVFNSFIIRSAAKDGGRGEFRSLLNEYGKRVVGGCEDIKTSCVSLSYFRLAGNTSQVLKLAAAESRGPQRLNLLLYAVELKNLPADPELLKMLLSEAPQAQRDRGSKSFERLRSLIETTVILSEKTHRDPQQLRSFLESIDAWKLASDPVWALSAGAQQSLWMMMAKARMMYLPDKGLHPDFVELMKRERSAEPSLWSLQKKMQAGKILRPEAVGARFIEGFDELYFLSDQVFLQKIAPHIAAELVRSSGRSAADLALTLENYARLRFAGGLFESTLAAEKIFRAAVPTEQLLMHALRQSSTVKQIWAGLDNRMETLKSFSTLTLQRFTGEGARESQLRALFNSLDRQVNMASVYPHTLLLFHLLSQKRFKLKLPFAGELDSGDLMSMLFYGVFPPLLDYSDEITPLNHVQVIHAFDMAVRTGLFKAVKIQVDEFMSDTLKRLGQEPITFIEDNLNIIQQRFQSSHEVRDFRNACREFSDGARVPRVIGLGDLRSSPYYGALITPIFERASAKGGKSGGDGAIAQRTNGLMYLDGEHSEALERVRLNLDMYQRLGKAMLKSYSDYLKRFERLSEADIEKRTAKTRAEIENMKKVGERTLSLSAGWMREAGRCYFKLGLRDYEMIFETLVAEEAYLRQVHRDIRKLRRTDLADEAKQELIAKYRFSGLPSGFQGQDRIDHTGYHASQIDLLIRISRYLQEGIRTETESLPALAPHVQVDLGYKLDVDVPLVADSGQRFLQFVESEAEFVASGLRAFFASRDAYITWLSIGPARIVAWTDVMKSVISLYRLELALTGKNSIASPEVLLGFHEEFLKLTEFSTTERRILSTLHIHSRTPPLYLSGRVLDYTVGAGEFVMQDLWGLYDLPVKLMNLEKLGYDYDISIAPIDAPKGARPRRFGFMEFGKLYYEARSKLTRGNPLIPYNAVLDSHLDSSVRQIVANERKAITGFHEATLKHLTQVMTIPATDRPRVDVDLTTSIREPLLTPTLIPSYEATQREFDQATQNCLSSSTCSDF